MSKPPGRTKGKKTSPARKPRASSHATASPSARRSTAAARARAGAAPASQPTVAPARPATGATPFCIVGIGASAGGFEPIRRLLSIVPPGATLAFVVIQHMDPRQKSLSTELFGRRTQMPVADVQDGVRVQAGHVYVLSGGQDVTIHDGVLHLETPQQARGRRMPIDHFFVSLGEDQHQRAVGVVLSGTGADGAVGLKSIVGNGGIVLVQRPETAQFNGMPQAALDTGLVTHTLAVEDMPTVLVNYADHAYVSRPEEPAVPSVDAREPQLRAVLDLVRVKRGYDFTGYKRATLLRRVHRRMGLRHVQTLADYVARLRKEPGEIDALFRDLLISTTEFFRDPEAWQALDAEVIAPLVMAKGDSEPIRIWVAGASTGEEAYTVAMLVLDRLEKSGKHCPVQVFATDTSEEALQVARMGVYPAGIAAQVSAARLHRYFNEIDDGHRYQVTGELRERVVFGLQNLFSDPPFSNADLVTCRNVLIYLEPEIQRRVFALLHYALKPDGYLFLGHAETPGPREDMFKPVVRGHRIYRRVGVTPREPLAFRVIQAERPATPAGFQPRPTAPALASAAQLARQIIFDRFAPASVLVDRDFNTLYYSGPTDRFLVHPRGTPTHNLLSLLREGLRSRLRSAMSEALASGTTVAVKDAQVRRNGKYEPVRLTVVPTLGADARRQYLVVFEDEPAPPGAKAGSSGSGGANENTLVKQLEEELHVTREDLRATVETLERSNEELKVSNEEVVSVNEELQSSNEELQSSKEELQSLNEELNTVNQQLQGKVQELEVANNDLNNVLASSEAVTLFLDRELCIKWFSPGASKLLKLVAGDVGRPISVFAVPVLGESIVAEARRALETLEAVSGEARGEGDRWLLRRTLPYRTEDGGVDGVIVTFTDITESKRAAEQAVEAARDAAATLERSVQERTRQLRGLGYELAQAEESERHELARELHDELSQLLALARLKAGKMATAGDLSEIEKLATETGALLARAEAAVRTVTFHLSPPVLREVGLVPALEWLAEEVKKNYGLTVELDDDGAAKPLDPTCRAILFRAIRELLINVSKHAGVSRARVEMRRNGGDLTARIIDRGSGFDAAQGGNGGQHGFGLTSVRERLSFIGGSVQVDSAPGQGTEVTLSIPLSVWTGPGPIRAPTS